MLDSQLDDFLLPVENTIANDQMISGGVRESPTKRLGMLLSNRSMQCPESPDMKIARNRFGTLLTNIKHGDSQNLGGDDFSADSLEEKRTSVRARKARALRDKSVVFELRGKPFALEDGRNDTGYQLCRAWMRGQLTTPPFVDSTRREFAPNLPLELLVSRDIMAMPYAAPAPPVDPAWPARDEIDLFDTKVDFQNKAALFREYLRHWKAVKSGFVAHQENRSARFNKSVELLETVFHISQQNM